jgi:hypothetical protein
MTLTRRPSIGKQPLSRIGLLCGLLLSAMTAGMASIQVEVNGRPLSFRVPPMSVQDRTMVPLREIFEALNARVRWNATSRTISATKDGIAVELGIGETNATVNGQSVLLDVPAMILRGSTMVPIRFISEALGADVKWSETTQTVSIFADHQVASDVIVIPAGTVIPVTLDRSLSSATNNRGDRVRVTVRSAQDGDAEFPRGTSFAGIVSDVQRKGAGQPGMLELTFSIAQFPDGRTVRMAGSVISLDEKSITQSSDGRLIANNKTSNTHMKFMAMGTGAGLIIGQLLHKNLIVGGLLGAGAGYVYSETRKDKVKLMDVTVPAGTEFGVRLEQDLMYDASHDYVTTRGDYRRNRSHNTP